MRYRTALVAFVVCSAAAIYGVERFTEPQADAPLSDSSAAADTAPTATEPEAQAPAANELVPIAEFAAACFATMRARNPQGRLLSLTANVLADRCAVIVETDNGSGRWMFDWRDYDRGFVHEGELRWPDVWPAGAPEVGIGPDDLSAQRIAEVMQLAHAAWPDPDAHEWLYEVQWLPEPFNRSLVFVSFSDRRPGAQAYASMDLVYDGAEPLAQQWLEKAHALYPVTRFELREDHNFKGPIFESTALAEAAMSLEHDERAAAPHPLAAKAEHCMHWLRQINTGSRILRVGMDPERCFVLLENASVDDDFYLLSARTAETYEEHPSLELPRPLTANMLLDRSRLSSARVRERLGQAQTAGGDWVIERLAIVDVAGAMVWQFDGLGTGERQQIYLNEAGAEIAAPPEYVVSAFEQAQGFAATTPRLSFRDDAGGRASEPDPKPR